MRSGEVWATEGLCSAKATVRHSLTALVALSRTCAMGTVPPVCSHLPCALYSRLRVCPLLACRAFWASVAIYRFVCLSVAVWQDARRDALPGQSRDADRRRSALVHAHLRVQCVPPSYLLRRRWMDRENIHQLYTESVHPASLQPWCVGVCE